MWSQLTARDTGVCGLVLGDRVPGLKCGDLLRGKKERIDGRGHRSVSAIGRSHKISKIKQNKKPATEEYMV